MPGFTPEPLRVTCNSCGTTAETWDFQHPDLAVTCSCCPVAHDHTGLGCRPVTIFATAHLTLLDIGELMEMAAERGALPDLPASDRNVEVAPLWPCLTRPTPAGC
jgi:hypothetical protein